MKMSEKIIFAIFTVCLIANCTMLAISVLYFNNIAEGLWNMRYVLIPSIVVTVLTGAYVFPTLENFNWEELAYEEDEE